MFIYSFHANTIKFFAVICLALVALITLVAFVPTYVTNDKYEPVGVEVSYNYEKIKSNENTVKRRMAMNKLYIKLLAVLLFISLVVPSLIGCEFKPKKKENGNDDMQSLPKAVQSAKN